MDEVYLRAVGFSEWDEKDLAKLQKDVIADADKTFEVQISEGKGKYVEFHKYVTDDCGVVVRGIVNPEGIVEVEYFAPFAEADYDLDVNYYSVEHINHEPIVTFKDRRNSNNLSFLQHTCGGMLHDIEVFKDKGTDTEQAKEINIAGLSIYGVVLLNVHREDGEDLLKKDTSHQKNFVIKAKEGEKGSIELLATYEDSFFEIVAERLKTDDLFTVLESYFLPVETDEEGLTYEFLGTIEKMERSLNKFSDELVYKLSIDAAGTKLPIFINRCDVLGLPIVGMRLFGACKLQGMVRP